MRRRPRASAAALSALPPAPALAPSAHAAEPPTGTDGFYVDHGSRAKRWVSADPGDGRASVISAVPVPVPVPRPDSSSPRPPTR